MTREEKFNDYEGFVAKFKPKSSPKAPHKKTTDDCMTPPEVYEVVKSYVCQRWGVDPDRIVRPFWPGGDYEHFNYEDGAVVVDNPPFSIGAKIVRFYLDREIPFFLFCPSLTALSGSLEANHLICDSDIIYENGAVVRTSFVTSYGRPNVLESCPELYQRLNEVTKRLGRREKKKLPKYTYPMELVTAAMVQRYAKYGIPFEVRAEECCFVRSLDGQRAKGKTIFGGGLLLSGQKAAERAAAERAAAERAAAHVWELSDRERAITAKLTKRGRPSQSASLTAPPEGEPRGPAGRCERRREQKEGKV